MIRVGIIGYGYMGHFHKKKIQQSAEAKLIAILDSEESRRAEAVKEGYHVYSENQLTDFFQEPMDLVIVATQNKYHAYYVIQAMTAGFHVMCEKPAAMNTSELEEILAVSKQSGRIFTVHQPRRFDRDYLMLKQVVSEHMIGEIHTIESRIHGERGMIAGWRAKGQNGGGLLYDWGVHLIDQFLQLFPEEKVIRIQCRMQSVLSMDVEDYVELNMTFSNNVYAKIVLSTFALCEMPRWFALGNRGTLRLDDMTGANGRIVRLNTDVRTQSLLRGQMFAPSLTMAPLEPMYKEQVPIPNVGDTTMFFWNNLIASLLGDGEFCVKPKEAVRQMMILEAARKSNEINQILEVNI